ncbi:VOC family protein [Catellatospora citrea]|uniref:Glyoxalase/bleomycin resistance protein/dioxygenase n=1 Tax=Catellatospora citrea TaxID=53366 RepID=A0A8J3P478_9ACTN|nr:VOC family protein [Catellatospora citrea]RKE12354.1 catechol 2,3-dioxygenase-like lactoylglutathione lyase family enzyme [Catellatospora citrea]GIG00866.1 glyoxalase/bleomycin resistance protein/dioxygenase [Catellatospora citrea]
MSIDPRAHLRLARPSRDLAAAERFYVDGLGLRVLYRASADGPGEHDLLMLGWPNASWHLELVAGENLTTSPAPTAEDLLVLYLAGPLDDALVARLAAAGGVRISQGPYWDRWGVTVADPDGYRLVLSTRSWSNSAG